MNQRLMKISFSVPTINIPSSVAVVQENNTHLSQTVNFFNGLNTYSVATSTPVQISYDNATDVCFILLDYYGYSSEASGGGLITLDITNSQGWAPMLRASSTGEDGLGVTIFKQEVGYDDEGNLIDLTVYSPVDTYVTNFHLRDFNVKNNRMYKYALYPINKDIPLKPMEQIVSTKWQGWSITELHPVDSSMKRFTASSADVWVFNNNVETGDQRQNLAISEQQTLGMYPRYSRGRQNYVSSSVTCLLGQMLPAEYILRKRKENGQIFEDLIRTGGYMETLPFSKKISSNDRVDMLIAWRKLVYSSNPKLLKDRKGQSFLVTLNESSNNPNDYVALQPDTISFTWTEIGTIDGLQIVDTSPEGGGVIHG